MADSLNTRILVKSQEREHPTDEIGLAIDELDAILNLISNNFEDDEKEFRSPSLKIYRSILACSNLAESIRMSLNRLNKDYEVPFRSKAEMTGKAVQS